MKIIFLYDKKNLVHYHDKMS